MVRSICDFVAWDIGFGTGNMRVPKFLNSSRAKLHMPFNQEYLIFAGILCLRLVKVLNTAYVRN